MLKKLVVALVIGFVVWVFITNPEGAAEAVRVTGDAVFTAFRQAGVFFSELFS